MDINNYNKYIKNNVPIDKLFYLYNCIDVLVNFVIDNINPVFFVFISGFMIMFMYMIYTMTHGRLIVYIIDSIFDFLLSLQMILSVQVSIIMILLTYLYYSRTKLILPEEFYKSYPLKFKFDNVEYNIKYKFVFGFILTMVFIYPVIMLIFFIKKLSIMSSIFSLFPLIALSVHVSKENIICCEYSKYFEKLEKPITNNESFICNMTFISISFIFYLFNFS